MKRITLALAAATVAMAIPAAAMAAQPGFTTTGLNLRAGPGFDFPVVDRLPPGAHVRIRGCLAGYTWCDLVWRGEYGWAPGDNLAFLYGGRRVLVLDYGPEIGLPIVGFSVDTYWRRHYRHRHFYARLHDFDHGRYATRAAGVNGTRASGVAGRHERFRRNETFGARGANVSTPRTIQNATPQTRSLTRTPQTRTVTPNVQSAPTAHFNAGPARPRHETTGAAPSATFTPHASAPAPAVAAPHPAPAAAAPHPAPAPSHGGPGGAPDRHH